MGRRVRPAGGRARTGVGAVERTLLAAVELFESLELFSPAHRAQTERRRACNVPVCPRATDSYPAYLLPAPTPDSTPDPLTDIRPRRYFFRLYAYEERRTGAPAPTACPLLPPLIAYATLSSLF